LPIFEEEKNEISAVLKKISEDKKFKFNKMIKEISELFSMDNVKILPLSAEIITAAYLRFFKREKPFKNRDLNKSADEVEFLSKMSAWGDVFITESLIAFCKNMRGGEDHLIFCSDNIDDFAVFDEKAKKHILHEDVNKYFLIEVRYYRYLKDMLKSEFKVMVSKESSEVSLSDILRDESKLRGSAFIRSVLLNPVDYYMEGAGARQRRRLMIF